jgi:hypothetical protein
VFIVYRVVVGGAILLALWWGYIAAGI